MDFQLLKGSRALSFCLLSVCVLGLAAGKIDTFLLNAAEPMDVSIIQLVATPQIYDRKFVRVVGFVHLEFEGNDIYLHEEDFKHGLTKNSLWLSITDTIEKQADKYNDKYVLIEGTFNAKMKGHMEMNSGSIENIKRWDVWPARSDLDEKRKPRKN